MTNTYSNGKKQKKGLYSTNGIKFNKLSHLLFYKNMKVYFLKDGKIGTILDNDNKCPRKFKKVRFQNNCKYIPSELLIPIDYSINYQKKSLKKKKLNHSNSKKYNEDKIILKKEIKTLFNKYKKELNENILKYGVYVEYNNNVSNYSIKSNSDSEIINNLNKKILENIKTLDDNINNRSKMTVLDHCIPKENLLKIYHLSNDGSTYGYGIFYNKQDFYKMVEDYTNEQTNNKLKEFKNKLLEL